MSSIAGPNDQDQDFLMKHHCPRHPHSQNRSQYTRSYREIERDHD